MAAASIRAGFVTLRPRHDGELPAELRFAPELQLQLLGEEARGGSLLPGGDGLLQLRRERTGVYVTASTGELSFQPQEGSSAELPFRLMLDKTPLAEGELGFGADGSAPRLALRLATASAPAPDEGALDLELVLLVSSAGPPTALAATITLSPSLAMPVVLPGALLRSLSGRGPALEPIDEDVGVALPLPRRPPFLSAALPRAADWAPPSGAQAEEHDLRFFSGGGCDSDAELLDDPGAELTWFSAGLRVGMGVGLGVCLGVGLGAGILIGSYNRARARLGQLKDGLLK